MNRNIEKILKDAGQIKLSAESKSRMKAGIFHYIDKNPILPAQTVSPFTFKLSAAFALVLFLTAYVGVTEASIPGDLMYGLKINVNEMVIKELAFTDKAEAEVAVKMLDRRLEETVELIQEGAEPEDVLTASAGLRTAVEGVADNIENLVENNDLYSALSIIDEHHEILEAHMTEISEINPTTEYSEEILEIIEQIKSHEDNAEAAIDIIEVELDNPTPDATEGEALEEAFKEAQEFIE